LVEVDFFVDELDVAVGEHEECAAWVLAAEAAGILGKIPSLTLRVGMNYISYSGKNTRAFFG
jgi:hypothetical protein